MLERQVAPPPRTSRAVVVIGAALGAGSVALALSVLSGSRPPARDPAIVFVPVTEAVQISLPAPAAPPVPPPAAPPVHVGCTGLAATLGTPEPAADPARTPGDLIDQVITTADGCAIAVRTESGALHVSWDGGASFFPIDGLGTYARVALEPDRLVALTEDSSTLAILDAGTRAVRRVDLASLHLAKTDYAWAESHHGWITIATQRRFLASHDDGASWLSIDHPTLAKPKGEAGEARLGGITADGVLHAEIGDDLDAASGGGPDDRIAWHAFEAPAATGAWHEVPVRTVPPVRVGGWTYAMMTDRSWGCGGTEKLVASRGKTQATLAGELSDNWGSISLVVGAGHAYAQFTSVVYELHGETLAPIRGAPGPEPTLDNVGQIIGVDAAGGLLARNDDRLLRWTKAGGWRVLLATAAKVSGGRGAP